MTTMTENNLDTFNTVKALLTKAGAKTETPNRLTVDYSGKKYSFNFKLPSYITLKQGVDLKGKFNVAVPAESANVFKLVQKIKGQFNPRQQKQEKKVTESKQAEPKTVAPEPTTKKTEQKKMTEKLHVNPQRVTTSLTKKNWTVDKYGIVTNPAGIVIRFGEKSIRIHNPATDITVNVRSAVTTDQQLVGYIKSIVSGEKPTTKQTKGLSAPQGYADFFQKQKEAEEAAKLATKKAEDAKKPAPIMPENPAGDKAPTFDALNIAVTETNKAEQVIKGAWAGIASQFEYSISNLTKALHAEGKWPSKTKKDGSFSTYDDKDENGKVLATYLMPMGYKQVYTKEQESGIKGVGHMVNTAAKMFTVHNPKMIEARKKAQEDKAEKTNQGTEIPSTPDEKEVGKILEQMGRLAKKLSAQELKMWLESDPSVQGLWLEMQDGNDDDDMADLVDPELKDQPVDTGDEALLEEVTETPANDDDLLDEL